VDGAFAGGAWATEQTFIITQPEQPRLSIVNGTSQHTVKWPVRFSDFTLQRKGALDTNSWIAVTNAPVPFDGKFTVGVTNAPPAGYFRLSQP